LIKNEVNILVDLYKKALVEDSTDRRRGIVAVELSVIKVQRLADVGQLDVGNVGISGQFDLLLLDDNVRLICF
jgi:hypothetical protein